MAEPQITLYRDTNFGGRSVVLTTCGSSNLGNDYGFNDQTSSIRVQSGICSSTTTPATAAPSTS
ncbi:hypothetical protein [Corallococcus sp. 4LFB]|uniref:hypothetical protein n=1 Tax=Corallococcus sp. 4LFB TaxID=3383249 RepID=UPI0039756AC5